MPAPPNKAFAWFSTCWVPLLKVIKAITLLLTAATWVPAFVQARHYFRGLSASNRSMQHLTRSWLAWTQRSKLRSCPEMIQVNSEVTLCGCSPCVWDTWVSWRAMFWQNTRQVSLHHSVLMTFFTSMPSAKQFLEPRGPGPMEASETTNISGRDLGLRSCPSILHSADLQDRDVIWFLDNEASVASLIRVSCAELRNVMFSFWSNRPISNLQLHFLRIRLWVEWVDSDSNPSDGLSRLGICDPWTVAQSWNVQEYECPLPLDPSSILDQLAARGFG